MQRTSVHYIPESNYFYPEEELGNEEGMIDSLRADPRLTAYLNSLDIHRGDVVVLGVEDGYRNDYRFLWDGKQLTCLDYKAPRDYDYGIVPEEFVCIREFPIGYWDDALHGWNLNWIPCSLTLEEEILKAAVPYFGDEVYKSEVIIEDKPVEVYISFFGCTLEEAVTAHFHDFRRGNLLAVSSSADFHDCDLPRGPNIFHIVIE